MKSRIVLVSCLLLLCAGPILGEDNKKEKKNTHKEDADNNENDADNNNNDADNENNDELKTLNGKLQNLRVQIKDEKLSKKFTEDQILMLKKKLEEFKNLKSEQEAKSASQKGHTSPGAKGELDLNDKKIAEQTVKANDDTVVRSESGSGGGDSEGSTSEGGSDTEGASGGGASGGGASGGGASGGGTSTKREDADGPGKGEGEGQTGTSVSSNATPNGTGATLPGPTGERGVTGVTTAENQQTEQTQQLQQSQETQPTQEVSSDPTSDEGKDAKGANGDGAGVQSADNKGADAPGPSAPGPSAPGPSAPDPSAPGASAQGQGPQRENDPVSTTEPAAKPSVASDNSTEATNPAVSSESSGSAGSAAPEQKVNPTAQVTHVDILYDKLLEGADKRNIMDKGEHHTKYNNFRQQYDQLILNQAEYDISFKLLDTMLSSGKDGDARKNALEETFKKAMYDDQYSEKFKNLISGVYGFAKRNNFLDKERMNEESYKKLFDYIGSLMNTLEL
uniref:Merozoite surface protein 7 n=1 Tax=Plasmodium inui TaxID=52288 RepID=A0A1L2DWR7_9APIC|nr:merozoite surface protein 7 [Plasmodium inui]